MGVEELLVTRVQRTLPRGFQVIDRTFVTVVVACSAYSAVVLATPPGSFPLLPRQTLARIFPVAVPTTARCFPSARHSHPDATLLALTVPTAAFVPVTTLLRTKCVAIFGRVVDHAVDAGSTAAIRRVGRGGSRGVGDND